MNEKYRRTQYLICTAAGFTCLVLWLLAYQTVGALAVHGWPATRGTLHPASTVSPGVSRLPSGF
jgi:hypothetical protein